MNSYKNTTDSCKSHPKNPSMKIDGINLNCCQTGGLCKTETIKDLICTLKKLKLENTKLNKKNIDLQEELDNLEIIEDEPTIQYNNYYNYNQYNQCNILKIGDQLLNTSKGRLIELGRSAITDKTDYYQSFRNLITTLPDTEQKTELLNMYNQNDNKFKKLSLELFQQEVLKNNPEDKDKLLRESSLEMSKIEEID